ncbi:MAG: cysteine dioxygenase family protein [Bacteroidota bacterium]
MSSQTQFLPNSLSTLITNLSQNNCSTVSEIVAYVRDANVHYEDLLPWADFDHPAEDSYGRKLVSHGPNFEVMVMSWRPGDISAIHDHGMTQWGAVQVFGPAEHASFSIQGNTIKTLSRTTVKSGTILGVSHSLIHQMGNTASQSPFLSLHVYGMKTASKNITGDARIFDVDKGQILRVDGGVFYHLPTHEIKRIEPGPVGDLPTQLRHLVDSYNRLKRMSQGKNSVSDQDLRIEKEKILSLTKSAAIPNSLKQQLSHLIES